MTMPTIMVQPIHPHPLLGSRASRLHLFRRNHHLSMSGLCHLRATRTRPSINSIHCASAILFLEAAAPCLTETQPSPIGRHHSVQAPQCRCKRLNIHISPRPDIRPRCLLRPIEIRGRQLRETINMEATGAPCTPEIAEQANTRVFMVMAIQMDLMIQTMTRQTAPVIIHLTLIRAGQMDTELHKAGRMDTELPK